MYTSNKYVMVGSAALRYTLLNRSTPKDLDIWIPEGGYYPLSKGVDIHELPTHIVNCIPVHKGTKVATPNAIYTIKCSHLAWDIKWYKTKADILWLKSHGCVIIPELYILLKDYWATVHGNKSFLSLTKSKEAFFYDNVNYVYEHDYLHELVAYPLAPMYTRCLVEGEDVLLDKNKFDRLTFEDKVSLFREEISVIGFERWLAHTNSIHWYEAYLLALKKTITNLTKNWANDFIILNLKEFATPEYKYFENVIKTLKTKELKMSNVDLSIFEDVAVNSGLNIGEVIYNLCENDLYMFKKGHLDLLEYKHLDQTGGGEGGEEMCSGFFSLGGIMYRACYSYYSYDGHYYEDIADSLQIVKPVKKTVTVYETVEE